MSNIAIRKVKPYITNFLCRKEWSTLQNYLEIASFLFNILIFCSFFFHICHIAPGNPQRVRRGLRVGRGRESSRRPRLDVSPIWSLLFHHFPLIFLSWFTWLAPSLCGALFNLFLSLSRLPCTVSGHIMIHCSVEWNK